MDKDKDVLIITSVINISSNPLSYTRTRSVYSHEKRFLQTIQTIESVRKYYPDFYIVLVEGSEIDKTNENTLIEKVDYYMNISNTKYKQYIDSRSKAAGESSIILAYLTSDHFNNNKNNINSISKLSGRYLLQSNFINIRDYLSNGHKILAKYRSRLNEISTIFYCINKDEIDPFIDIVAKSLENERYVTGNYGCEQYYHDCWATVRGYTNIKTMGILGYIAVDGYRIIE